MTDSNETYSTGSDSDSTGSNLSASDPVKKDPVESDSLARDSVASESASDGVFVEPAALVDDPPCGGVLLHASNLADRLSARGWRVVELCGAHDKATCLHALGEAIGGDWDRPLTNLDAMWDRLTDLTEPTAVLWPDWATLAVGAPKDWAAVFGVLVERTRTPSPPFAVLLG